MKLLNDGSTLLHRDGFVWGAALGAELAVYLCDRVLLLASVKERGLWQTDLGNFHTLLGVGLRFIIN